VAFGYWFWGLFQLLQTGFYVCKSTRALPLLTAAAVVVNAFANLVLLPTLGFVGAAVATTLTFAVLCVATHARAREVYPLDVAWGRVLGPGALAAALAAVAVLAPLPDTLTPVGWKLLALAVWFPAAWRMGVPPDGREQVRAGLAALLRRR
jgi:peptidoglycan biosynthesis protein MviN/MurJ (putative lipid II flippase)